MNTLEKIAVARWREAIYSGELSPESSELLKRQMGMSSRRLERGLNRGSRSIARRLGYKMLTRRPAYLDAVIPRGAPVSAMTIPHEMAITYPKFPKNPLPGALFADTGRIWRGLTTEQKKLLGAISRRHEINEARFFEKAFPRADVAEAVKKFNAQMPKDFFHAGAGYHPPEIKWSMPPRAYVALSMPKFFSHFDPEVVLREARHARMATTPVQRAINRLRVPERPYIPKRIPRSEIQALARSIMSKLRAV